MTLSLGFSQTPMASTFEYEVELVPDAQATLPSFLQEPTRFTSVCMRSLVLSEEASIDWYGRIKIGLPLIQVL